MSSTTVSQRPWHEMASRITDLQSKPIVNPSNADVKLLAPHLSTAEVTDTLRQAKECYSSFLFVGPPMRVSGALQVYELRRARSPGGVMLDRLELRRLYAARSSESYDNTNTTVRVANAYRYAKEAQAYAMDHWVDKLIVDESRSVMRAYMLEPAVSDKQKDKLIGGMVCYMGMRFPEVLYGDYKPECEILEERLLVADHWFATCEEMLGRHSAFTAFYCAICGGPIKETTCGYCKAEFKDYRVNGRGLWFSALPYRLATLIEEATTHNFKIQPIEARKADYREWAQSTFVPPSQSETNWRQISFAN